MTKNAGNRRLSLRRLFRRLNGECTIKPTARMQSIQAKHFCRLSVYNSPGRIERWGRRWCISILLDFPSVGLPVRRVRADLARRTIVDGRPAGLPASG
jgi:hypothetical protein